MGMPQRFGYCGKTLQTTSMKHLFLSKDFQNEPFFSRTLFTDTDTRILIQCPNVSQCVLCYIEVDMDMGIRNLRRKLDLNYLR